MGASNRLTFSPCPHGHGDLRETKVEQFFALSNIFARYAQTLFSLGEHSSLYYAAMAIVVLTALNIIGVKIGKWTQNLLTVTKILGLATVSILGLAAPGAAPYPTEPEPFAPGGLKLALILVLFTFGGWNEMAYVAGEIKHPQKNIVRGLIIGTVTVTALYLLINGAFLSALKLDGVSASQAVAVDVVRQIFPQQTAARGISVLICISALGAVNGLVFTGARISYALGSGHKSFRVLGKWNRHLGTPVWSLVVQGVLALAIVLLGGSFLDTILYTAPVVWLFFLATALSVFILRRKEPHVPRPYKIVGYPGPPIIFSICGLFMLYSCLSYAFVNNAIALGILSVVMLAGGLVYLLTDHQGD